MSISNEKKQEIFYKMCVIRNFEEQARLASKQSLVKCLIYLSSGQEALAATVSSFFKPDLIFAQHRGHSVYLAFGGDKGKLINELLCEDSGCTCGKGGSPGIQDLNIGMMGHHGLIGENVPIAVGAALGDPTKKILCVFGDGAAEEDYIFPSIGFAITHKLPILFFCEDNNLAILTKKSYRRNWELTDALKSLGIPTADIPDDPELIAYYVDKFKNNLPAYINCRTCRHGWHVGSETENSPMIDRLRVFKEQMLRSEIDKNVIENIENQTKKEMEELWKKHLQKQ